MAGENIKQVYDANPITSNVSTDLMYFGQSPYGPNNNAAMLQSNFAANKVTTLASSVSATYFPLFVASSSNGNQIVNLGTGLGFNPSSNTLTTTIFAGALSGNATSATTAGSATTATTATNATNIATTAVSTNVTWFPLFVASATNGNQAASLASSGFGFNPSTATLTVTNFAGSLTGNVTGNVSGSSGSCTGNAATASAVAVGGITGLGANVATALAAVLNGSGSLAATTSPTFVTPILGVAVATSINFGGTTLANYTQGTWTPVLVSSGGGTTTYSNQTATYTQIGNRVLFNIVVILSASSLSAGTLSITGFPFTALSTASCSIYSAVLAATAVTQIEALLSGTVIFLSKYAAGTATALPVSDLTSTTQFYISGQVNV